MQDLFSFWNTSPVDKIPGCVVLEILGALLTLLMSMSVMNVFLTQRLKLWTKTETSSGAFALSGISAVIVTFFMIGLCYYLDIGMFKYTNFEFSILLVIQFMSAALIVMIGSNWFFDRQFFKNFLSWIGMDREFQHKIRKYSKEYKVKEHKPIKSKKQ